jgi:MFS family permease
MSSTPPRQLDDPAEDSASETTHKRQTIEANEQRNLLALSAHHIVHRVAWIFKTETVIIPVFLDAIAGAGWLRGCLPVLNRIGQSIPSLLFAERLRLIARKKWALLTTSLLMAVPFLGLSVIWFSLTEKRQAWLPAVFLLLYFIFFSITGLNQLVFGTIQGKLIRAERRGRLMAISGTVGSVAAIGCAWFLLQRWLAFSDGGFGYIFGFTGIGFVVSGLLSLAIVEPADQSTGQEHASHNHFRDAWSIIRHDADFRRLAIVSMLFVTVQLLIPHYQALGRQQLRWESVDLMKWVIAQNAGAGLFGLIAGAIADRFGNRLTIRLEIFAAALTPALALCLTSSWFEGGAHVFWLTFFLLGLISVTFKTLVNYTLEITGPSNHPRYLSTLKVCMAIPLCLSPLVGLLIDLIGFEAVFGCITALTACGGMMTFRLSEPRHRL